MDIHEQPIAKAQDKTSAQTGKWNIVGYRSIDERTPNSNLTWYSNKVKINWENANSQLMQFFGSNSLEAEKKLTDLTKI